MANPYSTTTATAPVNTLYKTPSQSRGDFRPISKPRAKTYEAVTAWQRREMVDVSRVIAAGVTNIDAALIQAGEFSVGDSWHIKYRGVNKGWGKKRDEWFNFTYARNCNARGPVNDWHSSLRQFNWTRKVEADYGVWFNGQPYKDSTGKQIDPTGQFNTVKFDRISTGLIGQVRGVGMVGVGNGLDAVKELPKTWNYYSTLSATGSWPGIYIINDPSSRFDGQRIIDGIIMDADMRVVGYRIIGFTEDGMPCYSDIPAAWMHFNYSSRKNVDLIRGIPEIAEAIIPQMHLDDIQNLIEMAIKLASALAVTRESTDGNPASGGRATFDETTTGMDGSTVTQKRAVQEIFPGIIELATNNKEKLAALGFDRPSMNEENFIKRIEKSILHKLWPRDLIYAEDSGRAGTRAIAVQARTICNWDQICLERTARWIADRSTEFAMRAGYIPANDNLYDPYDYVFTVPAQFTVDEGNDMKMRLAALGRCIISRGIISEMDGYLAEEIEEQRVAEVDRLMTAAEQLQAKHDDFDVKEIYLMLDNSGSQISFSDQAKQEELTTENAPTPDESESDAPTSPTPTKPSK